MYNITLNKIKQSKQPKLTNIPTQIKSQKLKANNANQNPHQNVQNKYQTSKANTKEHIKPPRQIAPYKQHY